MQRKHERENFMNSIKEVSRCACQLKKSSSFHEQFDPLGTVVIFRWGGSFLIRREKQSRWRSVARAADWLNRYFLHYKITNCPNNRTISQDICTLFTSYLYSTLCSWIAKQQKEWFTLCVASHIEVWNQEIFGNCSEKLVITLTAKRSDRPRIFELSTLSAFKDLYKIIFLEIIQIMKTFERL